MSGGGTKVFPRCAEEILKEQKLRRGSGVGEAKHFVGCNGSPLGTKP